MAYASPYEQNRSRPPAPTAPSGYPAAPAPAPAPTGGTAGAVPRPTPGAAPAPPTSYPAPPKPTGGPFGDLSGFQTYEQWQAADRAAGGQGQSADVQRHFATGGNQPTTENYDAFQPQGEQQTTARLPAGTFPDDHPDAGKWNTGDAYLDELRSGKVAGSEDWRRFSNAQLKEWQPYYLGNGRFRTEDGGISDKPTNSTRAPSGGGGAGGPGGPGGQGNTQSSSSITQGSSSNYSGFAPSSGQKALDDEMMAGIRGMMNGTGTRYTPEAMQGLLAAIKQQMEGSKARQVAGVKRDAASRGMSRAGRTGAAVADVVRGAEAGFTGEYAKVLQSKIDADFQDKTAGLDRAQKYLDSLRDNLYRNDLTAMQREQFKANLALGYANLRQQRENLMSQLQNSREMQRAGAGYQLLGGGV